MKPIIPRRMQIALRRRIVTLKRQKFSDIWPINPQTSAKPIKWNGWPEGKQFALVLTHDVESDNGQRKCYELMDLEKRLGFRSSFNFVPERYKVQPALRANLIKNGFGVGVHGLTHDGKLFSRKEIFLSRSTKINQYLNNWNASGFRSPAMHHNLDWLHLLNITHDMSTFDTDPFEPQPDAVGTIFPFWVKNGDDHSGFVELPYTLAQDFTLFILLREKNVRIWQQKLNWIANHGGMALVNTHPDYMNVEGTKLGIEEYPLEYYKEFLQYVKEKYENKYWHVLPHEMANFITKMN